MANNARLPTSLFFYCIAICTPRHFVARNCLCLRAWPSLVKFNIFSKGNIPLSCRCTLLQRSELPFYVLYLKPFNEFLVYTLVFVHFLYYVRLPDLFLHYLILFCTPPYRSWRPRCFPVSWIGDSADLSRPVIMSCCFLVKSFNFDSLAALASFSKLDSRIFTRILTALGRGPAKGEASPPPLRNKLRKYTNHRSWKNAGC